MDSETTGAGHEPTRAALGALARLWSRIWLQEIDEEWVRCCEETVWSGVLPLPEGDRLDDQLDALAVDYCGLFAHPTSSRPPVQSVWVSDRYEGEPSEQVRWWFACAGYDRPALGRTVPDDHIGIQIDLAGHLLADHQPWRQQGETLREMLADYYQSHLAWSQALWRQVEQKATTAFYREAAGGTWLWLEMLGEFTRADDGVRE